MNNLDKRILEITKVYDNNGETYDRYTVFTPDGAVYGMSEGGEGFNQYIGDYTEVEMGEHLGTKLDSVPESIKTAVLNRMVDSQFVDLFQYYELMPENVSATFNMYYEMNDNEWSYDSLSKLQSELKELGYTFDYGLDAEPYGLRPIELSLNQLKDFEEYENGGSVSESEQSVEFEYKGKNHKFSFVPDEPDMWTSFESHGLVFDVHYDEDYNEIVVYEVINDVAQLEKSVYSKKIMKKGGSVYNKGRSWYADRARYNKNEDWEIPMRKRKKRFKTGGGVEEIQREKVTASSIKSKKHPFTFTFDDAYRKGNIVVQRIGGSDMWTVGIDGKPAGRVMGAQTKESAFNKAKNIKFAKGGIMQENTKLRDWYIKNYPTDELGKEINDGATFLDLLNALNNKENVYEIIGVGDSVIRERLFEYLSLIYDVDYAYVYRKWLESAEYENGGNINSGRDALFKSQEPHEQRYKRKREWKEYKKEGWFGDWFRDGGSMDDYTKSLGMVRVKFADPKYNYETNVSGDTTEQQARQYFVGKVFSVSSYPYENFQRVIDIDFYPKGTYANGGGVTDYKFIYMMLGRLQSDNDYYLGYGNRSEKYLWAGNVDEQIKEMKRLWNSLPKDAKPEWLSMQDILDYEIKMKNKFENGGGIGNEEEMVKSNLYNGEISCEKLTEIIGCKPNYPYQIIGAIKLEKCYLRNYYKIV